jgi:SAM-dependent methyltransferase
MNNAKIQELEKIAENYHLNDSHSDKFIEDICQNFCCEWLASLLSEEETTLELGYGEGITTNRLHKLVKNYSVLEGSPSIVKKARKEIPNLDVIAQLFENYIPRERYSKVLALHVFEHMDNPEKVAESIKTWLADDGEVIAIVPNKNSIHRQLAFKMGLIQQLDELSSRDKIVGHQRVYDLDSFKNLFMETGFEIIEAKGFFLKPLSNSQMLDYSPQLLNALNEISFDLPAELGANIAIRAKIK